VTVVNLFCLLCWIKTLKELLNFIERRLCQQEEKWAAMRSGSWVIAAASRTALFSTAVELKGVTHAPRLRRGLISHGHPFGIPSFSTSFRIGSSSLVQVSFLCVTLYLVSNILHFHPIPLYYTVSVALRHYSPFRHWGSIHMYTTHVLPPPKKKITKKRENSITFSAKMLNPLGVLPAICCFFLAIVEIHPPSCRVVRLYQPWIKLTLDM
jgi:hypothetical protein